MRYLPSIEGLKQNPRNLGRLYGEQEYQSLRLSYCGLLIYQQFAAGQASAEALLHDFYHSQLDFNDLMGSFRVIIQDKGGKQTLFGDNAGHQLFYMDERERLFSESFLRVLAEKKQKKPDPIGVTQFLLYDHTLSNRTLCADVQRTDPGLYYVFENGQIRSFPKNLADFDENKRYPDLHSIIRRMVEATEGWQREAVITGGTDSRAILAHLVKLQTPLSLSISGSPDNVDVKLARQISDRLHLPLLLSDMSTDDPHWLRQSFIAGDGVYGAVGMHRLRRKAQLLRENGFQLEFGGVAGELYKNVFIRQDYPFYTIGRPNYSLFAKLHFPSAFPERLAGPAIRQAVAQSAQTVLEDIGRFQKATKFKTYTSIGYYIMQQRAVTLTNNNDYACAHPLMDRNAVSLVYERNPLELNTHRFQREEIQKYCPDIAAIRTDRGGTCLADTAAIKADHEKFEKRDWWYLPAKSLYHRFTPPLAKGRPRMDGYFEKAFQRPEYAQAIDICKELQILPGDISLSEIPMEFADQLLTVGMAFGGESFATAFPR